MEQSEKDRGGLGVNDSVSIFDLAEEISFIIAP